MIYIIEKGDTLYSIAKKYDVSSNELIDLNELKNPENLVVGQTIIIPKKDIVYKVIRGDSLYSISKKFGVDLDSIKSANPNMINPYFIYPGDQIIIPLEPLILGNLEANGFIFPNINIDTLNATLPNLTYLSVFSYQVRPDGTLSDISDTNIINSAIDANVAPLMTITNIEDESGFSGEITNIIFDNKEIEQVLITNILEVLESKNYYGVVVDFEYIKPKDKDNYTEFLKTLTDSLHPLGYLVFSALAPKTSSGQIGTLYEAHDYEAIGQIVDRVIVMTYEWGYLFGPPLPVAPVNLVKEVLDYAVSAIPADKILMGVPNYGYDWTLPFVQGTSAKVATNVGTVNLAREVGSFIEYDDKAQAPFFNYYKDDKKHIVWFEDARSIDAKLRLVNEYGLAGVSYWQLNSYFPQNWLVQNLLYDTIKVL